MFIANDSKTNNSVCQAMLASFAKALLSGQNNTPFNAALVMYQSIPTGYIPPSSNPQGFAQKNCPGGRDLTFESCPGAANSTRAGIL